MSLLKRIRFTIFKNSKKIDRKLHCFNNLEKPLIYNSNKKFTLKNMIYKYKLEIQ